MFLERKQKRLRRNALFRSNIDNLKKIQQFYGKFDFTQLRKLFFDNYKTMKYNRMAFFLQKLEQRADVIFFRMRFLPTIYSSNFFIKHHGILINNKLQKNPNLIIQVGDILSLPKSF